MFNVSARIISRKPRNLRGLLENIRSNRKPGPVYDNGHGGHNAGRSALLPGYGTRSKGRGNAEQTAQKG